MIQLFLFVLCRAGKPHTHYKLLFFAAIFIRLSRIEYLVSHVGVEMKTLTSLYVAVRNRLFSRARKNADHAHPESTENIKTASDAAHTEQSNRGDDTQGFSVNTLKTGDKENGDTK